MRDKRFIAEHRGGSLKKDQHIQLIIWACECAENILSLEGKTIDHRLTDAIKTAYNWTKGNASVGDARNASMNAIAVARESTDQKEIAIARCIGHAVASAHMADHSLRASDYALKAVKLVGRSIEEERKWQDEHLPLEISDLVLTAREKNGIKARGWQTRIKQPPVKLQLTANHKRPYIIFKIAHLAQFSLTFAAFIS